MMWIDAHCHVGPGLTARQSPEELLRDMDRLGIDQALISPWDAAIAVENRAGNDYVLTQANRYPDRLSAYATVNPWYGRGAVDELRRATDKGARALKLATHLQGCQITDDIVFPIVAEAVALGLPIYVTTGIPVSAMPMQLSYLARTFPQGVFIEGRYGFPDFWTDALPSVQDTPNIYVDASYNPPSTILNAVRALGADRVLFSSDSPYLCLQNEVEKMKSLPVAVQTLSQIVGANIARLLQGRMHA